MYKLIFAPIHYFYGKNFGSEPLVSYEIYSRITKRIKGSIGICYSKLLNERVYGKLIFKSKDNRPYYYNIFDNLKFMFFYCSQAFKYIDSSDSVIIHHILPFKIGKSFNPLFLLTSKKVKKIIGPLQATLDFENTDLNKSSNFKNRNNEFVDKIAKSLNSLFRFLSKRTLLKADHIIVMNEVAKKEISQLGVDPDKITVIPIGIDVNRFAFIPYSKKDKKNIELVAIGYLINRKGFDLVLRSLKEVSKKHKNVRLRIIGDGPQKEDLMKLAKELSVDSYTIFEGFVPYSNIVSYYQNAHIFVSMSRSESWGQVYIDAMACGLPVISSENLGANEIVKSTTGYLVKQEDYMAMAQKVLDLIKTPELISNLGKNARKEIENRYDWEKIIIPQYQNIYVSL